MKVTFSFGKLDVVSPKSLLYHSRRVFSFDVFRYNARLKEDKTLKTKFFMTIMYVVCHLIYIYM